MLLSYGTGFYVGYNLANKVSTTGDATISGNLNGWSNIDRWLTFECATEILNKFRNFGI